MKKVDFTYIAVAALLALPSCKEDVPQCGVDLGASKAITLRALLPSVSVSRGEEAGSENGIDHVQVTAFHLEKSYTEPYLENERFRKRTDGHYYPIKVINCIWPDEEDHNMEFYAHYPQLDNFVRSGKYSIDAVSIPSDISKHFDFMTARRKVQTPKVGTEGSPVDLNFQHQLSRIKIEATAGDSNKYSFEIAGIRIGNPVVEGKYSYYTLFTNDALIDKLASIGSWVLPASPKKHKVEYIFKAGDQIVSLGNEGKSIMGLGGNAMVIPASIPEWEIPADPTTVGTDYTTGQMYFSVLLRVKGTIMEEVDDKEVMTDYIVYPYEDVTKYPGMDVVYLAVDASNKVLDRVYMENVEDPYVLPEGASIKKFGWAAIPVGVNWETGRSYLYTLDYSNGIGYHDPDDPDPGTPIVGKNSSVTLKVQLTPWEYGEDTDVNMPSPYDDITE